MKGNATIALALFLTVGGLIIIYVVAVKYVIGKRQEAVDNMREFERARLAAELEAAQQATQIKGK